MSDIEARLKEQDAKIKALMDQLTPDPDKISTMKVTNLLKSEIDHSRNFTENKASYEDVLWRLLGDREAYLSAVQQLEKENDGLKKRIKELEEIIES